MTDRNAVGSSWIEAKSEGNTLRIHVQIDVIVGMVLHSVHLVQNGCKHGLNEVELGGSHVPGCGIVHLQMSKPCIHVQIIAEGAELLIVIHMGEAEGLGFFGRQRAACLLLSGKVASNVVLTNTFG